MCAAFAPPDTINGFNTNNFNQQNIGLTREETDLLYLKKTGGFD